MTHETFEKIASILFGLAIAAIATLCILSATGIINY